MNVAQMKQIYWKEYRTQRSIWLGITLMIVVLQAIVYAMMPQNANNPLETLMGIGAILTTFYALASAGVLFAGEREEETDGWLMILPTSRLSLVSGKVLWLLSSWVIAIGLTCFTAYLPYWGMEWGTGKPESHALNMLRYGGSMVAWGLFFSLICKRVYSAIAFATIAFLISASMIQFMAGLMDLLSLMAIVGSVVVGRHWLSSDRLVALPQFAIWADKFNLERALASSIESSPGWKMFRRQLWLEWRNARYVAIGLFLGLLMTLFFVHYVDTSMAGTTHCILVFAVLPLLVGTMTYRGEQYRDAYRFQANVGVSSIAVWCSKHLVWGGVLFLLIAPFSLPFLFFVNPAIKNSRLDQFRREFFQMLPLPENALPWLLSEVYDQSAWQTMALWLSVAAFMYAVGHVCSLLLRRSVSCLLVAMAVGTILSLHLFATVLLNVPLPIAIGLPVFAMLVFTTWRTGGWLEEKNDWKEWRRMISVALLLTLFCASSWTMWRMYQITYLPFHTGVMAFLPITGLFTISVAGFFMTLLVGFGLLIVLRRKLTVSRLFVSLCVVHITCTAICMASFAAKVEPPDPGLITTLTPTQDAVETGNRYRELELLVTEEMPMEIPADQDSHDYWSSFWKGDLQITAEQEAWLDANESVFNKVIANTQRPTCAPENLFDINDWGDHKILRTGELQRLYSLLRLKALVLEKQGDLNAAWEIHHAILNFHRQLSRHQLPQIRSWNLSYCRTYLQQDFVRWVNHADQDSTLMMLAALQFSECLDSFSSLKVAFELESTHRQWVVDGNMLGLWGSGNNNVKDWPVYLNQLIHSKWPTEESRAMLMLQQIGDRQEKMSQYLGNGKYYQFSYEIAAEIEDPFDPLQNRRVFISRSWNSAIEESNAFWQLAASTPVIQASETGHITGLPTPIMRPSYTLLEELNWLRYQRLTYLSLALRIAELEGYANLKSLDELVALKSEHPNVAIILNAAEQRFNQKGRTDYNLDTNESLKMHYLYHDPVARNLLDMPLVKTFLNRTP